METITVIPFRKGSQGLQDKALQELGGMTLLEHTLRQALDWLPWPVVLFSDYTAEEIEDAGCYLSGTPIVLHDDSADGAQPLESTLCRAAQLVQGSGAVVDAVAWMTPNTPVRKESWVKQARDTFIAAKGGYRSVFVAEPTVKQIWGYSVDGATYQKSDTVFRRLTRGVYGSRQTMPPSAYIEHTGVFCVSTVEAIPYRIGHPCTPVLADHPWVGLDIHTQADLEMARWLYERGDI